MASKHSASVTPQRNYNKGDSTFSQLRDSRKRVDHAAAGLSEKRDKEELQRTTAAKNRAVMSMSSSPVKEVSAHATALDYLARSRSRSRSPGGLDVGNEVVKSELEREIRCERLGMIHYVSPFRTEMHIAEDAARRLRD